MARDREDPGHAASGAALRRLELTSEPHLRERADDRVRENVPRRLPGPPLRSVPERRHPRRDGAVISFISIGLKARRITRKAKGRTRASPAYSMMREARLFFGFSEEIV